MGTQGGYTLQTAELKISIDRDEIRRTPPCPRRVLAQLRNSTSYTYISVSSPARTSNGFSVSLSIDHVTALIWSVFFPY